MAGLRGVVVGALALIVLQVLVTAPNAGRLASLVRVPGDFAVRFLDPTIPAIPQRTEKDDDGGPFGLRRGGLGGLEADPDAPRRRYPDPYRVPVSTTNGGD
jgi:hypothetical protein